MSVTVGSWRDQLFGRVSVYVNVYSPKLILRLVGLYISYIPNLAAGPPFVPTLQTILKIKSLWYGICGEVAETSFKPKNGVTTPAIISNETMKVKIPIFTNFSFIRPSHLRFYFR
jgi:hypothetical protein